MALPVELVGLLKHAGINVKKLTWDLQVNSSDISQAGVDQGRETR